MPKCSLHVHFKNIPECNYFIRPESQLPEYQAHELTQNQRLLQENYFQLLNLSTTILEFQYSPNSNVENSSIVIQGTIKMLKNIRFKRIYNVLSTQGSKNGMLKMEILNVLVLLTITTLCQQSHFQLFRKFSNMQMPISTRS